MITCKTISGGTVELPEEKFVFRPTVYGVIKNGDDILVVKTKKGQIILPGGAVEIGETIEEALKRETREETGIEIKVGDLFCTKECYLYNDLKDEAYQKICFYYHCKPESIELTDDEDEIVSPEWVDLAKQKQDTSQMGGITTQIFNEL